MKLGNLDKLKDGPTSANAKLNNLVHTVNYLMRLSRKKSSTIISSGIPPLMCEDDEEESTG